MLIPLIYILNQCFGYPNNMIVPKIDDEPETCEQVELIIPDMNGIPIQTKKDEFCFDKNYFNMTSKNCHNDCKLKIAAKKFKGKLKYSQRGTPGSWLCTKLKGKNTTVYLSHNGEKHKMFICTLDEDIISVDHLTKLWHSNY